MSSHRILVAEDDESIRTGLVDTLLSERYAVDSAIDGRDALSRFEKGKYQLALLDVMMPEVDGYAVCREIRAADPAIAIIMVTAKGEEFDKVLGLKLGADDYVTKPFGINELLARVEAALRRYAPASTVGGLGTADATFSFGVMRVSRDRYEIAHQDSIERLTGRELQLLEIFSQNPNKVLSRNYLLDAAWGVSYYGTTRTLDQHIAQIRKKFQTLKAENPIETAHGIGYRYVCS